MCGDDRPAPSVSLHREVRATLRRTRIVGPVSGIAVNAVFLVSALRLTDRWYEAVALAIVGPFAAKAVRDRLSPP